MRFENTSEGYKRAVKWLKLLDLKPWDGADGYEVVYWANGLYEKKEKELKEKIDGM